MGTWTVFGLSSCKEQSKTQGSVFTRLLTLLSGRAATFFSNIPWLGIYVGKVPALVRPIQIFVAHGQKSVARRMARGSTTRDLFHYLVRQFSARILWPLIHTLLVE